ncbi:MAG: ribonuclease III, partial [Gammaproteobacteria bacterium]|nr:ribonuclease III [Gammaproteobacteria bacterium]
EAALGYTFVDRHLLTQALTHRSARGEEKGRRGEEKGRRGEEKGRADNERLEFLGDAILGYVVARHLFATRPGDGEDMLSLMRASVVKGETLAEVAGEVGVAAHLRLGVGERRSGGHKRASILADAMEAVIGAVHQDGGVGPAEQLVLRLLESRLQNLDPESVKDPKTRLQELLQGSGLALPEYAVVDTEGSDHSQVFSVCCRVDALGVEFVAKGSSRRGAEKQAAEAVLAEIEDRV